MNEQWPQPRQSRAQAAASATPRHVPLLGISSLLQQDVLPTADLAAGRPQDPCRQGVRHQRGLGFEVVGTPLSSVTWRNPNMSEIGAWWHRGRPNRTRFLSACCRNGLLLAGDINSGEGTVS